MRATRRDRLNRGSAWPGARNAKQRFAFVRASHVVVEFGYRDQTRNAAGTSTLEVSAVQRVLLPDAVVDFEYEANFLPAAPAARQHAFGAGVAFEI